MNLNFFTEFRIIFCLLIMLTIKINIFKIINQNIEYL